MQRVKRTFCYLVVIMIVCLDIRSYQIGWNGFARWYKNNYQLATLGGAVILVIFSNLYFKRMIQPYQVRESEQGEEESKQDSLLTDLLEKCTEAILLTSLGAFVQAKVSKYHLDNRIENKASSVVTKYHPDQIELSSDYIDIINKHDKIRVVLKAITHPHLLSEDTRKKGYGLTLKGPPGTGKSMLAKLFAKKSNSMLFVVPTPLLTTTYFGDGALTIRHIFEEAKKEVLRGNRVVLFFDEFDSIGNRKNEMSGSGGESQKATLNALLTEMNSINDYEGRLVVITATNDETAIDEALTRSKRFGRSVRLDIPTRLDRLDFIKAKQRRYPYLDSININGYLDETDSFSYADLEEVNDRVLLSYETEYQAPNLTLPLFIQEVKQEKEEHSKKNKQDEREEREKKLFEMQCEQEKRTRINSKYQTVDQVKGTIYGSLVWQAIKNVLGIP